MSGATVEREIDLALDLDTIPNTPYFPLAMNRTIHHYLRAYPEIQVAEDPFAIYVHYSYGNPRYKFVIDTHLDHPGFIVLGNGTAIPVGTIAEPGKAKQINERQEVIPVHYFDREGNQRGEGYLHNLTVKEGRTSMQAHLNYPTHKLLPANTQAIPQVTSQREGNHLLMRSADNLSVTAIALTYLQWLLSSQIPANVTIVFTKMEEVRQVSATAIAQRGMMPFGVLDDTTQIIVLEAGLVGSTDRTRQVAHTPDLSYEGGTLVRVSDHEWPYQREGQANLAEALMLHARDAVSKIETLKIQHGPSIGNCNALPYAFFSRCPHISSLMIPCVNKHNFDQDGCLVPEKIAITDILSVRLLLEQATILAQGEILPHSDQILLPERRFAGNSLEQISVKKRSWQGALAWAEPRLRGAYFSPTTPLEQLRCNAASLKSRLL